jgi:hypothetical protein
MAVECFDPRKKLSVISAVDEDLCVVSGGGHKNRERTGLELMLFEQRDFIFTRHDLLAMRVEVATKSASAATDIVHGVMYRRSIDEDIGILMRDDNMYVSRRR